MKASVKYNDFIGSSAADFSDDTTLDTYLNSKKIDTERFNPIGVKFFSGYNDYFNASFICIDKEKSSEEEKHIVEIVISHEFDRGDFFNLFKRFEVLISKRHNGYQDQEIKETLMLDELND